MLIGRGKRELVRKFMTTVGLRRRPRPDRGAQLLERYGIQVVLDVGANAGQFAYSLWRVGYRGRIVSFEPLSSAFRELSTNARGHRCWQTLNLALGDFDGERTIHVAGNSESSSLLEMLPRHVSAAPHSAYVGTEAVQVRRLDSIVDELIRPAERCFLKLDVQGFERSVLNGAGTCLPRFLGVQLEMSLVPLYGGEVLFQDMLAIMSEKGYCLMSLTDGFAEPKTGQVLQLDGVFYRRDLIESVNDRVAS